MLNAEPKKPRVAIHKFSSCDGCQLAFLNLGENLIKLTELVNIVHFVEAGTLNPELKADISFIEGSISTAEEAERIQQIRNHSRYLISLGACATSGGLQALRNRQDTDSWVRDIYAHPEYISTLSRTTPISDHVRVDLEVWGCPVNSHQILSAIRALILGVTPAQDQEKLCAECKRQQQICVMVAQGKPCMGPVTRTGCGVLCPGQNRDCYACYGPAESPNTASLTQRLRVLGFNDAEIARRFAFINNNTPSFAAAAQVLNHKD